MTAPTDNPPLDLPHRDSLSSVSTTSLVFDYIEEQNQYKRTHSSVMPSEKPTDFPGDGNDEESVRFLNNESRHLRTSPQRRISKAWIWAGLGLSVMAVLVLFSLVGSPADGADRTRLLTGNPVTLDSVLDGEWSARSHGIAWIAGPNGEDGLLMEQGAHGKNFLVVSDVRLRDADEANKSGLKEQTLIKSGSLSYHDIVFTPTKSWPNAQLTKVLVASSVQSHWRHSFTASYWIVDVATQEVVPLIPEEPQAVVQLATWSPTGDSIAFTRDNNLFTRAMPKGGKISAIIKQVTKDGGREYFYGIPDWVYEEEVFSGNSATWWSDDGKFIAFLRTNESSVVEYPVDFFVSRPSGPAKEGQDLYPDVQQIKYPKAGTPNPVVELMFYSTEKGDVFTVNIDSEHRFADDDRLITTVLWAGDQVLVKETNRVSDIMHVVLIDPKARIGKTVQNINVKDIDGGWFEISTKTRYVPADPTNHRPHSGYIDTVIYNDRDHLAYFSPIDTDKPVMLTQGDYEVIDAPSAVDVKNNLVYFVSTQKSSIERHIYSVKLDGSDLKPLTNVSAEGYYDVSFSKGAGFALLSYRGPDIPWQKVVSTPSTPTKFSLDIENNIVLSQKASETDLPTLVHGTIEVDGVLLNYVERRPANFDRNKKYPVLFQQYSGPGSQSVNKRFAVDFQSYVPSSLGYITVTVDGRGTGYIGRKNRVIVRGQLGITESHDQIAAAKYWSQLDYIDADRLAIWGWSFGGFSTLKTLEQDAGQTFKYGMAVAPVTDWRFYDSIYTERYMLTPQMNSDGYARSAVNNATALSQNVRFLVMHGTGDDNVHIQNTYTLLDRLDLEGVENYDVHVFPDSNHGIYFHGASRVIHDKLSNWLVNAFNGEWLKVDGAVPKPERV